MIVVYKVDRLTRALSDFAKMVDIFDEAGVSFVSVTQAFNTTSSMGRLTLNVLLSFAQFEREVTAERIRDKVAASKKKGLWMGGAVPTGYDVVDKHLVVNEGEAKTVRTIYQEYLLVGSVPALRKRLAALGVASKLRTDRHGRVTGGGSFSTGALYYLLRNPVYVGTVRHRGQLYAGQHDAIVEEETWLRVEAGLDSNGGGAIVSGRRPARRWLDGRLFDREGRSMRTTYAIKSVQKGSTRQSKRYWYYVSRLDDGETKSKPDRLPADGVERVVETKVREMLSDRSWLADAMTGAGAKIDFIGPALDRVKDACAGRTDAGVEDERPDIRSLVHRIDLGDTSLRITLDLAGLTDGTDAASLLVPPIEVPVSMRQAGRNRPIVLRTTGDAPHRDSELISLVADARRWRDDLLKGRAASVAAITEREKVRPGTVSRILPLAWLAPDISRAILAGRQPAELTAKRLRELPGLPLDWNAQRRLLGFPAA